MRFVCALPVQHSTPYDSGCKGRELASIRPGHSSAAFAASRYDAGAPRNEPTVILILHAHPYPGHSRAGKALLDAARDVPGVRVHSLYDRYPDFDIDAAAEQAALSEANLIVWLHPIYWYSVPALLKHWFEKVLVHGWAYGPEGNALKGKHVLWVPTTGGDELAYTAQGMHEQPFANFIAPVEETVRYCGMTWEAPFVVHGAHLISPDTLAERARAFRQRLLDWRPDGATTAENSIVIPAKTQAQLL